MRVFILFCALSCVAGSACADVVCRRSIRADFGPFVTSHPANAFVIANACDEPRLTVRRSFPLTVRFSGEPSLETPSEGRRAHVPRTPFQAPSDSFRDKAAWTVWFRLDDAELTSSAKSILDAIPSATAVRVEGHACPLGREDHNLKLSRRRAESVKGYLQARSVTVVAATGQGECCPVSVDHLARNRRAEIKEIVP